MEDDYYALLGVDPDADARTVRAAYLGRMRMHHPDRSPGDPGHVARRLNAAYDVLRDPARRAAYDRVRAARLARGGGARAEHRSALQGHGHGAPVRRRVENPAYSPENRSYYVAVSRRLTRIGGLVFVVGLLLLVSLSV